MAKTGLFDISVNSYLESFMRYFPSNVTRLTKFPIKVFHLVTKHYSRPISPKPPETTIVVGNDAWGSISCSEDLLPVLDT